MVRGVSQMFVAGPPLVERAFGTPIDKESLGGWKIQVEGCGVDNVVDSPLYGPSLVTALARLDGYPVAVLANDPAHAGGALTAAGSEKMMRFVDLADTFHLPVVNFVDQPGFSSAPRRKRKAPSARACARCRRSTRRSRRGSP